MRAPKLHLCGLGHFPPYTTSLNVLHVLTECDVVVSHDADAKFHELLPEFCPGIRSQSYRGKAGARSAMAVVMRELRRGKVAGFVTRGHPCWAGGPAAELARHCRKAGIECETFGAVSSIGMMLARLNKTLGVDMHGLQAYHARALESTAVVSTLQPLVIDFSGDALASRKIGRLRRALQRRYPRGHCCWMFGPRYEAAPEAFRLEDMERRFAEIGPGRILYVPPF